MILSNILCHYKAAISRDRLLLVTGFCPVDDDKTRGECKSDKFCNIHKIFNTLNHHCKELYGIASNAAIDEILH